VITLPDFFASVARAAKAVDSNSRTLTVEFDVPNSSGELLSGAYANVHFQLPLNVTRSSQIEGQRIIASVVLVKALGGDSSRPASEQTKPVETSQARLANGKISDCK